MIIAKGQLVASDTPENLSKLMLGSNTVTCTVHGTRKQLVPALNALDAKEIQYENTPNEEQIKVKITTERIRISARSCSMHWQRPTARSSS